MLAVDPAFWRRRRVFVTGHTGFKGAWLTYWLRRLEAEVTGYALAPTTTPSLHALLGAPDDHIADILDADRLAQAVSDARPEIIFHLAAQALVRASFADPVGTFATNVTGTAGVLDAARKVDGVSAVVVVTSDKCYENREWPWGYREIDALGGHDPYSASKGAAEIVVASMRRSFFAPYREDGHPARIASVRAGNVVGGGDWSPDRLVPDIVRAGTSGKVVLRNPSAVRPWQHVLDPCAAYLGIAQELHFGASGRDTAFNIGPTDGSEHSVRQVADAIIAALGGERAMDGPSLDQPHEAHLLRLDCSKATAMLRWRPIWDFEQTIEATAAWYARHVRDDDPRRITDEQIAAFETASRTAVRGGERSP